MKLFLKTLIILLCFSPVANASESRFEEHLGIKNKAYAFLDKLLSSKEGEYSVEIQNIDYRIKLKKCISNIDIKLTQANVKPGKNTLNVQCGSPVPWRIFMTAKVKIFANAIVYKYPLSKGHLLKKDDIKLDRIQLSSLRSAYYSDPSKAVNRVLKRRVNRGDIVSVNNLSKPTLIKKGDTITILAKNKGFQISMKGIALTSGGKGDKIKVKNIKTKKTIQGVISNSQTVKVNI